MKTGTRILLILTACSTLSLAGPPFQTDDPEPIEFRHYEFYTFGLVGNIPGETDVQLPAFEFNWGPLPNTHLHIIVPAQSHLPGEGARTFGLGDIELGIKYRFVQETKFRPQIGTFVMFEIPTGNSERGLGVGRTWYKLPIWVQKSFGPWTTYGGGGVNVVPGPDNRNYDFEGWLLQRELGKKLTLGGEVFHHGQATNDTRQSTMVDLGGYYKFHGDDSFQLLFAYGHSVAGQREQYGYLGLYWTWGDEKKDQDKSAPAGASFSRLSPQNAFRRM